MGSLTSSKLDVGQCNLCSSSFDPYRLPDRPSNPSVPPISWEVIQCRWPGDPCVSHGWASVGMDSGMPAQSGTHPLYFTGAWDHFSCWVTGISGSSILPLNILLVFLEMVVNCLHGIFYPVSLKNLWFTQPSTPTLYTRPVKQSVPESVIPSAVIFIFV